METVDQVSHLIALSMGLAWASGINLYAAVLALALLANTGNIVLPEPLQLVESPLVLVAAGIMYFIEFFADKIPGVDSGWDAIQTFIRIPAGAMLAAASVGEIGPAAELAAGILGGGMAASTHATKAGTRVLINASPEPVSNWSASIGEDLAVIGGVWAALNHPYFLLGFLVLFVGLLVILLPRLWRGIKAVVARLARLFDGKPQKTSLSRSSASEHRPSDPGMHD
jgi:hypothetical protein